MIILGFSFISCEKEFDTAYILTKSLSNKTNTDLYYFIETNVGRDSIISYGNDSVSLQFIKKSHITLPPIGPYDFSIEGAGLKFEILYNLSDTSAFNFNLIKANWSKNDSIYSEYLTTIVEGSTFDEHLIEILQFQDTLKSIMTKDYSMLTRFKEYYSK